MGWGRCAVVKRARYSVGATPIERWNARRMVSALAKPQAAATRSTGARGAASRRRARRVDPCALYEFGRRCVEFLAEGAQQRALREAAGSARAGTLRSL